MRTVVAFILAPLAASFINAAIAGDPRWFLVAAPFAYLFSLAGVPFYFLFRRLGWLHLWQIVLASAVLGGVVAFAAGFSGFGSGGSLINEANALKFIGYGAVTGLVFWVAAFSGRRSNNSFKPKPLRGSA